jgi:hypothetical protein
MTSPRPLNRTLHAEIYANQIRPALLDNVSAVESPQAVVVCTQPGGGSKLAAERIRKHLSLSAPLVIISSDALRAFHPDARAAAPVPSADQVHRDVAAWYRQLTDDSLAKRASLILLTTAHDQPALLAWIDRFNAAGYDSSAVFIATDKDTSRQINVARFDLSRSFGVVTPFIDAQHQDHAYSRVLDALAAIEAARSVRQLQVITPSGQPLFANRLTSEGRWATDPLATAALDDYRERARSPQELADSALRWQTLAHRLASDPTVPRDIASQVMRWRDEAWQEAEQHPDSKQRLAWGREAEAFRVMAPATFASEFPHLAKAAQRIEEAMKYASETYADPTDRERFVQQTRQRLVERIAEGKMATVAQEHKVRAPRTR